MDARELMVRTQLAERGIRSERVLEAMGRVPRERFVTRPHQELAYADRALPIGCEQTISQPFMVAYMTEALDLSPTDRVLEVGTGSGYQAAVLAELVGEVYTIERVAELYERARVLLTELGHLNVQVRLGDGSFGWPTYAPFDAIVVTCAAPEVPPNLLDQLAPGGRLCIPIGEPDVIQDLCRIVRQPAGDQTEVLTQVRFVPLVHAPVMEPQ